MRVLTKDNKKSVLKIKYKKLFCKQRQKDQIIFRKSACPMVRKWLEYIKGKYLFVLKNVKSTCFEIIIIR